MDARLVNAFQLKAHVGKKLVSAREVVGAIKRLPRMCEHAPYLDCVTNYALVQRMTREFADLAGQPKLEDLDAFVKVACSLNPDWEECQL